MDSIEIEGKEYVSAKRAAREHRYTMDYVGQLIRAGKIDGKKVGRAWYVDLVSLEVYTQSLGTIPTASAQDKIAEVEVAALPPVIRQVEAPAHRIELKTLDPVASESVEIIHPQQAVEPVEPQRQPEPVYEAPKAYLKPVRESLDEVFSMRYLEDSEPTLPSIVERKEERAIHQQIAIRTLHSDANQKLQRPEVEEDNEEEAQYVPARQRRAPSRGFGRTLRLAAGVAVIVFVLSLAAGSVFVDRTWHFDGTAVTAGVSFSQDALNQ